MAKHEQLAWFDQHAPVGEWRRFTFVRHPYTRMLSFWRMACIDQWFAPGYRPTVQDIGSCISDPAHFLTNTAVEQTGYPYNLAFIGRYENFEQDVKRLFSWLGHADKLPEDFLQCREMSSTHGEQPDLPTAGEFLPLVPLIDYAHSQDLARLGYERDPRVLFNSTISI